MLFRVQLSDGLARYEKHLIIDYSNFTSHLDIKKVVDAWSVCVNSVVGYSPYILL